MTFYTFLMKYRAPIEKDDITRLANLAFQDTLFPKQSTHFDEISTYLETQAPFYFNLTLFDEIWQMYLER
ncbi:MAG: YozE family protein [Streptococcaceae bacterium]|nr:YozE family protein [Streptococcaceae bacterium]MCL2681359.1 YozE family protein [Streptococcaceae bacterium]MCL2858294.1 YozE family protein [Streptococcaceae bacterium]